MCPDQALFTVAKFYGICPGTSRVIEKKPVKKCIPLYSKYTINTQTELFP